jgi:hypothetical protein
LGQVSVGPIKSRINEKKPVCRLVTVNNRVDEGLAVVPRGIASCRDGTRELKRRSRVLENIGIRMSGTSRKPGERDSGICL